MIYSLTIWQIWIQVTQLYTQKNPKITSYETSYLAETPVTLPEMKQQIRLVLKEDKNFVKDLNPRALRFRALYRPIVNGKR